jgi:hypothetical protein
MITNSGINLLSKYIAGQLPTFASHIAVGCGPTPLNSVGGVFDTASYAVKESLDFEMLRVPITSRTVKITGGESYAIFTAELPSINRYAISEIGIYPAEQNNVFGSLDSFVLNSFSLAETWSIHNGSTITEVGLETTVETSGSISPAAEVFVLKSDNAMFNGQRLTKQEQPRYLGEAIAIKGSFSTVSGGNLVYTGKHIHVTGVDLARLDQANQYLDELKLAFSIVNTTAASTTNPTNLGDIKIAIDFASNDPNAAAPTAYARWVMTPTVTATGRYVVETTKLSELTKTSGFKWSDVTTIRIYANIAATSGGETFYLLLDGLRFENLSTTSSQYSLAGYTVIKNTDAQPIIKNENGGSYVEYKFKLDVA